MNEKLLTLSDHAPIDAISHQFLTEVRSGQPHGRTRELLSTLSPARLTQIGDPEKLAFWINIYNAAVQAALIERPERYENQRNFFSTPCITVAGTKLSIDDIEHGILRRSQWKYGMGYIRHPFPPRYERHFRVAGRNYRIHFALNCGAASCPAIRAYTADKIEEQLNLATQTYLVNETVTDQQTLYIPRLFIWFRGDFGGGSGIKNILHDHGILDPDATIRIRYNPYDWSMHTGKYHTEVDEQ